MRLQSGADRRRDNNLMDPAARSSTIICDPFSMGFREISYPISEPEEMASLTSEVRNGQKGDTLGVLVNVRGCTERG